MSKKFYSSTGLFLLAATFLVFTFVNNSLFNNVRIDLTENSLFTLSDGSKKIVSSIDEPINIYFFFSEKASENLTSLRAYAVRVEELLNEYALLSGGKIKLHIIDPEPFSDAEDQAAGFGLQSVPISATGDDLYFGLAGTNALDNTAAIPFFQPDKEEFLEYDISKLIQSLTVSHKPVIGLLSSLPVQGKVDRATYQSSPAWTAIQQLEQLFEIKTIASTATELPKDVDLLMLIHPKGLGDEMLRSIDQFLMSGGKMLAFVDPLAESDTPAQANPMMPSPPTSQASDLNKLTSAWGITLQPNMVLGDSQGALQVGGSDGVPVRHLAIIGLTPENFDSSDVVTADLGSINVSTAGIMEVADEHTVTVEPLIESSEYSMPMDSFQFQFLRNPADLQKSFVATGKKYIVAARISGKAKSAFAEDARLAETDNLNVILVADTDLLTDRLWVQVQNFFGQQVASPFANNGDFVVNALDNLSGSSDLISIRSRGKYSRPFTVVQNLRREAEVKYLESANNLQAQLTETESKLAELQGKADQDKVLRLNPQQEQALLQFQDEKLRIRKQLRAVQHQLNDDIDSLGSTLKFLNIALVPILLTLLLMVIGFIRRARRSSS